MIEYTRDDNSVPSLSNCFNVHCSLSLDDTNQNFLPSQYDTFLLDDVNGELYFMLLTILTLIWISIMAIISILDNLYPHIMIPFPSTRIQINVLLMSMGSAFIGTYPVLMCLC